MESKQDASPKITRIAEAIAMENILAGEAVGIVGTKPKQYKRFEKLTKNATENELLALSNHRNGVVKCYAFWALDERNSDYMFEALLENFDDTTSITTQFGCIISRDKVGDIYYNSVVPRYGDDWKCKLSDNQMQRISDSLLESSNLLLRSRLNIIQIIDSSAKNIRIIRNIAIEERIPEAIYTLSYYQNKSDIPLIIELIENESTRYLGFQCIDRFPDPIFYQYLIKYLDNIFENSISYNNADLQAFYIAIINYKNSETKQILKNAMVMAKDNGNEYHQGYLWHAIRQSEDVYFNDIFPEMAFFKDELLID